MEGTWPLPQGIQRLAKPTRNFVTAVGSKGFVAAANIKCKTMISSSIMILWLKLVSFLLFNTRLLCLLKIPASHSYISSLWWRKLLTEYRVCLRKYIKAFSLMKVLLSWKVLYCHVYTCLPSDILFLFKLIRIFCWDTNNNFIRKEQYEINHHCVFHMPCYIYYVKTLLHI